MSERPTLRQKAVAAYEASVLKQQDDERNRALIHEIGKFFQKVGLVSIVISSNPFRFDDLVFFASELKDVDGVYGYELLVSRQCSNCKENIVLHVDEGAPITAARFGQWLLEPHLCEFFYQEPRKSVKGFRGKGES